jgi:hypothetical protein
MMEAFNSLIRDIKRRLREPDKSIFDQQKEVIDAAEEFDRLTAFPAWIKALRYMAEEVNGTLVEATKHEGDPSIMMWEVVRWNAKRQLLDNLQGMIQSTLAERDRIVEEYKEIENGRNTSNGN